MNYFRKIKSLSINGLIGYYKNKKERKRALVMRSEIIAKYFANNEIIKLHVGCGPFPFEGWLNTDLLFNEDVAYLDAGEKFPLESNSVDFIFCEHLFEHLNFEQSINMLSESLRVLKNGGRLRVATPNLEFLLSLDPKSNELHRRYVKQAYENHWNLRSVNKLLEENQQHEVFVISNFFRDWGHQIIHNFSSLELLLKKVGFDEVIREQVGHSQVKDLCGIEHHHKQIGEEFNLLETLVIEAIKK